MNLTHVHEVPMPWQSGAGTVAPEPTKAWRYDLNGPNTTKWMEEFMPKVLAMKKEMDQLRADVAANRLAMGRAA